MSDPRIKPVEVTWTDGRVNWYAHSEGAAKSLGLVSQTVAMWARGVPRHGPISGKFTVQYASPDSPHRNDVHRPSPPPPPEPTEEQKAQAMFPGYSLRRAMSAYHARQRLDRVPLVCGVDSEEMEEESV